ncbi:MULTISPECIES: hypothetical protein [Streptomyces]|uniref:hypothetical protein n=1 Tax=Streptomyces TaxID=1883 RepID=UPI000A389DC7|nr:hypothetical protein [Streptomyces recifensis]
MACWWRVTAGRWAERGRPSPLCSPVAAVSYGADSGQLAVCPESAAWATKARVVETGLGLPGFSTFDKPASKIRTEVYVFPGPVTAPALRPWLRP